MSALSAVNVDFSLAFWDAESVFAIGAADKTVGFALPEHIHTTFYLFAKSLDKGVVGIVFCDTSVNIAGEGSESVKNNKSPCNQRQD